MQVVMDKGIGPCTMDNMRYLNMYEADFNYFQAVYIGDEATQSLTEGGHLSEEHFSKKGSTAIDAKFDATLMTDISRQSRNSLAIVSVDVAQCYDRVNHVMLTLLWIALLKSTVIVKVILECLKTIKFYQRSGYGDSTD